MKPFVGNPALNKENGRHKTKPFIEVAIVGLIGYAQEKGCDVQRIELGPLFEEEGPC